SGERQLVGHADGDSRQRNFAADAVHLAYTAGGALHGNVSGEDKLCDIAVGLLIATEAGCRAEWISGGEVSLQSWLDGTQPDDLLLVAPPRILAALRAAFLGGRSESIQSIEKERWVLARSRW